MLEFHWHLSQRTGVFKITTDGTTLVSAEEITLNLPEDQAYFSIVHQPRDDDNPVFVGTSLGVYRIDDTLTEWEPYDTNFPNTAVSDLEISPDDGVIVASTYGRGVWQSPIPFELPANELKLIEVTAGSGVYSCGDIEPQLTVQNNGQNPITDVQVIYELNDGGEQNFTYTSNIASGQVESFALPNVNAQNGVASTLEVTATVANDAFNENNSQRVSFLKNNIAEGNQVFDFEDAEGSLPTFNTAGIIPIEAGGVWEIGEPTGTLLNTANSGTNVVGTNLDGNHPDLTTGAVILGCYDLSTIVAPKLASIWRTT